VYGFRALRYFECFDVDSDKCRSLLRENIFCFCSVSSNNSDGYRAALVLHVIVFFASSLHQLFAESFLVAFVEIEALRSCRQQRLLV